MNRGKKLSVPNTRTRASSNSTPTRRGTSTPTSSSSSTNQSCSITPIKKVETSQGPCLPERTEPKLLKPLGPTLKSRTKALTDEEQISFLYMVTQQQEFLNASLEDTKNRVMKESQNQLEKLYAMVREKHQKVALIKNTTQLLHQHMLLTQVESKVETTLKDTKNVVEEVTAVVSQLADGLHLVRDNVPLTNLNPPAPQDFPEIKQLLEKAAKCSNDIPTNHLSQVVEAASTILQLETEMADQLKTMEEVHHTSSKTVHRLGQELALKDSKTAFRSLADLEL